jgi:hypothetical protein
MHAFRARRHIDGAWAADFCTISTDAHRAAQSGARHRCRGTRFTPRIGAGIINSP